MVLPVHCSAASVPIADSMMAGMLTTASYPKRRANGYGYSDEKYGSLGSMPRLQSPIKRRKITKEEKLYEASCVSKDMKKAKKSATMKTPSETTQHLGKVSIRLKGVKLVHLSAYDHDGDHKRPFAVSMEPSSSWSGSNSVQSQSDARSSTSAGVFSGINYERMFYETWSSYKPSTLTPLQRRPTGLISTENSSASPASSFQDIGTSSTSETTQVVFDMAPVVIIPPRLDDSIVDQRKSSIEDKITTSSRLGSHHIITSRLNSVTMNEMMQLSDHSRLVVEAAAPFNLVYFNASFARMLSIRTSDQVYGKPFSQLLIDHSPDEDERRNGSTINLSDLAISSSNGVHQRVIFQLGPSFEHRIAECRLKVSPVVDRKTTGYAREVSRVLFYGIEVIAIEGSSQSSLISETSEEIGQAMENNLAVGVMG